MEGGERRGAVEATIARVLRFLAVWWVGSGCVVLDP